MREPFLSLKGTTSGSKCCPIFFGVSSPLSSRSWSCRERFPSHSSRGIVIWCNTTWCFLFLSAGRSTLEAFPPLNMLKPSKEVKQVWIRVKWVLAPLIPKAPWSWNVASICMYGPPWRLSSRGPTCQSRRLQLSPWVRTMPWRREWQLTPVFLPGESYGQRNLAGYSLWGHRVIHDLTTKQKQAVYTGVGHSVLVGCAADTDGLKSRVQVNI